MTVVVAENNFDGIMLVESISTQAKVEMPLASDDASYDGAPWEREIQRDDPLWAQHEPVSCTDSRDADTPDNWVQRRPVRHLLRRHDLTSTFFAVLRVWKCTTLKDSN